jgi:hypothetical protein
MLLASKLAVDPLGHRFHPGAGAAFVVLVAFLLSFLAIRTSARLTRSVSWWLGGVQTGGVHVHHLVWGIGLMLLCGFLAFAAPLEAPWWHVVAIGFGVGAGVALDEYALWLHLDDVYWAEQGRVSFDAVVASLAFAALVVLGTRPFGLDEPLSIWGTTAVAATVVAIAAVAFAKGRFLLGVIGLFIPLVALAGAVRLARLAPTGSGSAPPAAWPPTTKTRCGPSSPTRSSLVPLREAALHGRGSWRTHTVAPGSGVTGRPGHATPEPIGSRADGLDPSAHCHRRAPSLVLAGRCSERSSDEGLRSRRHGRARQGARPAARSARP